MIIIIIDIPIIKNIFDLIVLPWYLSINIPKIYEANKTSKACITVDTLRLFQNRNITLDISKINH